MAKKKSTSSGKKSKKKTSKSAKKAGSASKKKSASKKRSAKKSSGRKASTRKKSTKKKAATSKKKSSAKPSGASKNFDSQWKKFRSNLGAKWDGLKKELDLDDLEMDEFLAAVDQHVNEGRKTLKKALNKAADKL